MYFEFRKGLWFMPHGSAQLKNWVICKMKLLIAVVFMCINNIPLSREYEFDRKSFQNHNFLTLFDF